MVKLYVVRHAHAGSRSSWDQPDSLRPLSPRGERQAVALVDLLTGEQPRRLVSSPAVRCVDTLRPLGAKLGLGVEVDDRLAEGARAHGALGLLGELAGAGTGVVCSHGDVIPDLLELLRARGVELHGELRWPKGSTWELTWNGGGVASARLLSRG